MSRSSHSLRPTPSTSLVARRKENTNVVALSTTIRRYCLPVAAVTLKFLDIFPLEIPRLHESRGEHGKLLAPRSLQTVALVKRIPTHVSPSSVPAMRILVQSTPGSLYTFRARTPKLLTRGVGVRRPNMFLLLARIIAAAVHGRIYPFSPLAPFHGPLGWVAARGLPHVPPRVCSRHVVWSPSSSAGPSVLC